MLKNINDYLSLISLILLTILTIRYTLGFIFSSHRKKEEVNRVDLFKQYYDNEEE